MMGMEKAAQDFAAQLLAASQNTGAAAAVAEQRVLAAAVAEQRIHDLEQKFSEETRDLERRLLEHLEQRFAASKAQLASDIDTKVGALVPLLEADVDARVQVVEARMATMNADFLGKDRRRRGSSDVWEKQISSSNRDDGSEDDASPASDFRRAVSESHGLGTSDSQILGRMGRRAQVRDRTTVDDLCEEQRQDREKLAEVNELARRLAIDCELLRGELRVQASRTDEAQNALGPMLSELRESCDSRLSVLQAGIKSLTAAQASKDAASVSTNASEKSPRQLDLDALEQLWSSHMVTSREAINEVRASQDKIQAQLAHHKPSAGSALQANGVGGHAGGTSSTETPESSEELRGQVQALRNQLLNLSMRLSDLAMTSDGGALQHLTEEHRSDCERQRQLIGGVEQNMERMALSGKAAIKQLDAKQARQQAVLVATQQQLREELSVLIEELQRQRIVVDSRRFPSLAGRYGGVGGDSRADSTTSTVPSTPDRTPSHQRPGVTAVDLAGAAAAASSPKATSSPTAAATGGIGGPRRPSGGSVSISNALLEDNPKNGSQEVPKKKSGDAQDADNNECSVM